MDDKEKVVLEDLRKNSELKKKCNLLPELNRDDFWEGVSALQEAGLTVDNILEMGALDVAQVGLGMSRLVNLHLPYMDRAMRKTFPDFDIGQLLNVVERRFLEGSDNQVGNVDLADSFAVVDGIREGVEVVDGM